MLSLRERVQRSSHQISTSPQVGEVVLIKDNLPRSRWKVGKIVDLCVGKDQRIRSAKVFVSPHSYLHQPLSLLYPIEYANEGIDDVGKGNQSMAQSTESTEEKNAAVNNVPIEDSNEETEESTI